MNLSELQGLLKRFGISPSRKLGQSFLADSEISRWIVDQLDLHPEDHVVEVGPGFGALTESLVGRCRLTLVETDGRLAEFLRERYGEQGVEVIHEDATQYNVRTLFQEDDVKFIGNLPYSVGNAILANFLDAPSPVTEAVVMVQREVAERFVARPRSRGYGVLSLMLQERWRIAELRTVGPEYFYPRPAVDSTIVRFQPRSMGEIQPHCSEGFRELVKRGFSQRRKQLLNNLGPDRERAGEALITMGLPATVRAEELSLEEWVELSEQVAPHPCKNLPPSASELLEVVDEVDRVIELRTRAEIHSRKVFHRAVHVFVQNKRGEIFLQKRSHLKDSHPGKWDSSASGHVDPGESYAQAAERELWEELWVRPKESLVEVGKLNASEATDQEFIGIFQAEVQGRIRVHGKEVESGQWFSPELIERWIDERPGDFARSFVTCFRVWRTRV